MPYQVGIIALLDYLTLGDLQISQYLWRDPFQPKNGGACDERSKQSAITEPSIIIAKLMSVSIL